MSTGRTAEISIVLKGSRRYYRKRNPSKEITDIEMRIYNALAANEFFRKRNITIPRVERITRDTLDIEDAGQSFAQVLHHGERKETASIDALLNTTQTRAVVTGIVNRTISEDDQHYLRSYQRTRLRTSLQQLVGREVTEDELNKHYWAYRVMNAIQAYDDQFKERYTKFVGSRLDEHKTRYRAWVTDNCIRNNTVAGNGATVPIDFNSLHEELWQMDEAGIVPFYLFPSPIMGSLFVSCEERMPEPTDQWRVAVGRYLRWLYKTQTDATDTKDYGNAFMASAFHKHAMLAGYRTQEMTEALSKLERQLTLQGGVSPAKYLQFREAFDEIEYHESILFSVLWNYSGAVSVYNADDDREFERMLTFISENTRLKRTVALLSPVFNQRIDATA